MNRLEYCKNELKKKGVDERSAMLAFQELNNMLTTYREKKELSEYLIELNTKKQS